MDQKEKEKGKAATPIIDGDARPDMPVDTEKDKKDRGKRADNEKFTPERGSDMNSMEDYKDAK